MTDNTQLEKGRSVAMIDAIASLRTLPDGSYQAEKAGIIGTGLTILDAIADMTDKFAIAFAHSPK